MRSIHNISIDFEEYIDDEEDSIKVLDDKVLINTLLDKYYRDILAEEAPLVIDEDHTNPMMKITLRNEEGEIHNKSAIYYDINFAIQAYKYYKKYAKESILKRRDTIAREMYKHDYDKNEICNILNIPKTELEKIITQK